MTLCVVTKNHCLCQPGEGVFCPDYKPDAYVQCLMETITELLKTPRPEVARTSDDEARLLLEPVVPVGDGAQTTETKRRDFLKRCWENRMVPSEPQTPEDE